MYSTTDFRKGLKIEIDGTPFEIIEFQHFKPGKGGAMVRTKLRNILNGRVLDNIFRSGEKVERPNLESRDMQFLYHEGEQLVFMDMTTYDQIMIPKTLVGDKAKFLLEGTDCLISFHDGTPLNVDLPGSVILTITHTEPGLQGNRSNAGTKPATVETGAEIQVPLFINEGDRVKINTEDGSYTGRENN